MIECTFYLPLEKHLQTEFQLDMMNICWKGKSKEKVLDDSIPLNFIEKKDA